VKLAEEETIIYSRRDDNNHGEGAGILMSKAAPKFLMNRTPVSEGIIKARL